MATHQDDEISITTFETINAAELPIETTDEEELPIETTDEEELPIETTQILHSEFVTVDEKSTFIPPFSVFLLHLITRFWSHKKMKDNQQQ